jgi:hypothetical protein
LARRRGKTNASHLACAQLALGVGPEMRRGRVIDSNPGRGRGEKEEKNQKQMLKRPGCHVMSCLSCRHAHVPFFFLICFFRPQAQNVLKSKYYGRSCLRLVTAAAVTVTTPVATGLLESHVTVTARLSLTVSQEVFSKFYFSTRM